MKTLIRWSEKFPYPCEAEFPDGLTRVCVHRGGGEYPFLHDTSVTVLDGRLFLAWYQCTEGEIEGKTGISGCWSDDGINWSEPETVISDSDCHYVPAAFYQAEDGLPHGLVTCMTGHDRPFKVVEVRRENGQWKRYKEHGISFLFNTAPRQLPDGSWISGGRFPAAEGELPLIPAAAKRCAGSEEWQLLPFPGPWEEGNFPLKYPETALFFADGAWHAVARCDGGAAYTYRAGADGTGWKFTGETNLPAIGAKWYAGNLPDGRDYLLFNELAAGDERLRLVLLVREQGAEAFSKRFVLADGWDESLSCGPYWHYPSACVFEDALYVSCTSNKEESVRNAACIRVPLKSL